MADPAAEEQFGPYLVYERLGVGGMATVHRALERGGVDGFERTVALKRLLPHLAEDASFIKSFVREAKLAAALSHVNIVQIYELGRVGTQYFISMEYIDGRDIRRILRHARKVTGPPPLHVTIGLLLQLCDALDYAHAKVDDDGHPMGLVHRDVSPSNLLVTTGGHLKVIDFGIAKAQSAQLRTQTGRVKGKLAYMAPEAIAGRELDARSDLFAAGVIAHELLTARPLFASKNDYQTLLKVQRGDIMPPSTFNQACPPELDAIVLNTLARDPDDRPATAGQLREQLQALRRMHKLQATAREVATWCEWAFTLEPPVGFAGPTFEQTGAGSNPVKRALSHRPRTPRPATPVSTRDDEDAAVDIAWGGGPDDGNGAPIELDDVPDVSEKHFSEKHPGAMREPAAVDDDDIPTPLPSHGRGSARGHTTPLPRAGIATGTQPLPRVITSPGVGSGGAASAGSGVAGSGPLVRLTPPGAATAAAAELAAEIAAAAELVAAEGVPGDTQPSMPPASEPDSLGDQPTIERAPERASGLSVPRVARTKPGVVGVRARTSSIARGDRLPRAADAEPIGGRVPSDLPIARRRRVGGGPSSSNVTIGASIAARKPRRLGWVVAVVALGAAGAGGAYVVYGRRATPTAPEAPPKTAVRTTGSVKFSIEPSDAQIRIDGTDVHDGSPWSTEHDPGALQIEIHRDGYKAWLTSLELSAGDTQTLRVVLEPLAAAPAGTVAAAPATLILSSTPDGLEAVLDGALLVQRTPIKMPIKVGAHTIVLRDHGVEVWRQDVMATANTNYEFSPSMAADKQRERQQRSVDPQRVAPPLEPAPVVPTPADRDAPVSPPPVKATDLLPVPTPAIVPAVVPAIVPPMVPPHAAVAPAPTLPSPTRAPAHAGPMIVPPSAVTRIAGDTPEVRSDHTRDLPSVATAKVCIDVDGHVTSAMLITSLDRRIVADLTETISGWRYAPYLDRGAATPACFVVSFRLK